MEDGRPAVMRGPCPTGEDARPPSDCPLAAQGDYNIQ